MNNLTKLIIYNAINLICFTLLTIVFNKWWIILFAFLFIMIPTSKFKGQKFRVCDGCGRFSESDKTVEESIQRAEKCGWLHMSTNDKDFCPDCLRRIKGN